MNTTPLDECPPACGEQANGYRIGTLRYDRRGIIFLFGWLLWGDFAFNFFEQVFSRFMPLYLKDLNASNTVIGIMTGSIAGLVNVLFLPNISQWSDRFRSRLGRRIPFLLVVTPVTVFALVMVGFAPEVGGWLHRKVVASLLPGLSMQATVLSLLCFFVVAYHFFNMVLVNSYNWLLRDVVPESVMAKFLSLFRIVGTTGGVLFLWYVFPVMIVYRRETCLIVGLFYLISFLMMCWNVKEGSYPALAPRRTYVNAFALYGGYFRNCLSVSLYRNFFLTYILVAIATSSANSFLTLFAKNTLGLGMEDVGKAFAYSQVASVVIFAAMGWLTERYTAMRVVLVSLVLLVAGSIVAYFMVDNKQSWFIYQIVFAIPTVGWWFGCMAISMQLFPREDFGQFSSGLNVFGCGGLIAGNFLIGQFMDFSESNYSLVFLWSAAFFSFSIVPMIKVYNGWIRHGGPFAYVPPLPSSQMKS